MAKAKCLQVSQIMKITWKLSTKIILIILKITFEILFNTYSHYNDSQKQCSVKTML